MGGPTLQIVDNGGVFGAALLGFLLSLPLSLFLAYWLSAVKRRMVVVTGAFVGAFVGFLIILGWAGTLIFDTPLPNAGGGPSFFGSLLLCSALGLSFGILADVIVARITARDYRRQTPAHE